MAKKVPLDRLSEAIGAVLSEYGDSVAGMCKEAVEAVTKAGVKAVKAEAKTALNVGSSSRYVKGWTSQVESGRTSTQGTIYNKSVPGLPHLLEYGHATRNGTGRTFAPTPAHPHIAKVEQTIVDEFEKKIREGLQ